MGIYTKSVKEIKDAIIEGLDNIEGDFNREALLKALEACKKYKYVSDNPKIPRRRL